MPRVQKAYFVLTVVIKLLPLGLDSLVELLDEGVHPLAALDRVLDDLERVGDRDLVAGVQALVVLVGEVLVRLHHLVELGLDPGEESKGQLKIHDTWLHNMFCRKGNGTIVSRTRKKWPIMYVYGGNEIQLDTERTTFHE